MVIFDGKQLDIAIVQWEDCEKMDDGWQLEEDVKEYIDLPLKIMHSVGWLLCNDDRWVMIAQSAGNDRDGFTASDMVKIPKPMVKAIQIIDLKEMAADKLYGAVVKSFDKPPQTIGAKFYIDDNGNAVYPKEIGTADGK